MQFEQNKFYLTVDIVVFTIIQGELKIVLIKRKKEPHRGMFALPGGFVNLHESLDDAAKRELHEETGLKEVFLKRLHVFADINLKRLRVFADVNRDPRGRVVTVSYLALIDGETVKLHATSDAELAKWFSIGNLPELAFDHREIIEDALKELRFEIQMTNIAYQLLGPKFTMSELKNAYEIVLDKELDKRNFSKRIKLLGILRPTTETKMEGAHRPAQLFEFKDKEYTFLKDKINVFV